MDHGYIFDEVKLPECKEHCAGDTCVSASDATRQSVGFTSPRSGVALLPDCCVGWLGKPDGWPAPTFWHSDKIADVKDISMVHNNL